ncbi:hypothetical protein BH10PSE15_BH10PSE15_14630 [soil metagenome]
MMGSIRGGSLITGMIGQRGAEIKHPTDSGHGARANAQLRSMLVPVTRPFAS